MSITIDTENNRLIDQNGREIDTSTNAWLESLESMGISEDGDHLHIYRMLENFAKMQPMTIL